MSLPAPQEVVERTLAAAGGERCVVIVEESSQSEIRFANNTTTTNGRRRDRRVVVVRFSDVDGGIAAGVASQSGDVDVTAMIEAATADAESAPPSPDAAPLVEGAADAAFDEPPAEGELAAFAPILDDLAAAFDAARSSDRVLAGFVEHQTDTVYLGSSTGLRRRHSQPTGAVHMVARSADGTRSAWVADATGDLRSVDVPAMDARLATRLRWAERTVALDAGRYEVVLPPEAVADLMVDLTNYAGGQDAEEGRTVFSAPGGGTRIGERLCPLPFHLYGDPAEPGLECAPFLTVGASSSEASVFDNGMPIGATPWLAEGRLANLRYHRAAAAQIGGALRPAGRQPGARARRGPGHDRGAGRPDRAGVALDLPVVHPRGRPLDPLVDRPHPRRRLPRRGGRDRGSRQQLPLQREPGRPAGPDHRGRDERPGPRAGVRRVGQPEPDAATQGGRLQHELDQRGQLTGRRHCPGDYPGVTMPRFSLVGP